ncbi:LysR substrate-binding domain-containing protein [Variovorax sp. RT4R15]|uniref:LysR substrate-binding domain-containing protein n=1 Tax=Variovorax sp. RT4R15 TaxID=3443737 RepID=UPI003F479836
MIAARLGVGVLPLPACKERLGPRGLKAVRLTDDWAHRHLMLGYSAARPLSAAARLMVEHLLLPAGDAKEFGYSA